MLRIAGIALLLTLVTTCLLGGTIAKYVTSANGSDHARIAKFGINVIFDTDSKSLFHSEYETHDKGYGGALSVKSTGGKDDHVIAPGASGWSAVSITGTSEVAVDVSFDLTGTGLTGLWVPGEEFFEDIIYEPVLWTLTKNGDVVVEDVSLEEIVAELASQGGQHPPNTDLTDIYGTYKISWSWPFEGNDMYDHFLGGMAAGEADPEEFDSLLDFNLVITVTQID